MSPLPFHVKQKMNKTFWRTPSPFLDSWIRKCAIHLYKQWLYTKSNTSIVLAIGKFIFYIKATIIFITLYATFSGNITFWTCNCYKIRDEWKMNSFIRRRKSRDILRYTFFIAIRYKFFVYCDISIYCDTPRRKFWGNLSRHFYPRATRCGGDILTLLLFRPSVRVSVCPSRFDLVNTIETKPLYASLSNFADLLTMMRRWTLLILDVRDQRSRSQNGNKLD